MARKECPYRSEVECGDGDGDHDPGDSEAVRSHGAALHGFDCQVPALYYPLRISSRLMTECSESTMDHMIHQEPVIGSFPWPYTDSVGDLGLHDPKIPDGVQQASSTNLSQGRRGGSSVTVRRAPRWPGRARPRRAPTACRVPWPRRGPPRHRPPCSGRRRCRWRPTLDRFPL
jgi:hypothetical protein